MLLGNTLTGEFSRAQRAAAALAVRAPGRRRGLAGDEWCDASDARASSPSSSRRTRRRSRRSARRPSPAASRTRSPAGSATTSTSRAAATRVDGACASSLLAVAHGCSALVAGDLDVALAGGVDLSLDPFELVGFAKAGRAGSPSEMRVYDARSPGFWPGEGCGFVVLMRLEDAAAPRLPIVRRDPRLGHLVRRRGGITRPEAEGQLLALAAPTRGRVRDRDGRATSKGTAPARRSATRRARARSPRARREAVPGTAAAIGSIKANIGHTKAAAGVAGLHQGGARRARRRCCRRRPAATSRTPSCRPQRARARASRTARALAGARGRCARRSARWASAASTPTSCSRRSPGAAAPPPRRAAPLSASGRMPSCSSSAADSAAASTARAAAFAPTAGALAGRARRPRRGARASRVSAVRAAVVAAAPPSWRRGSTARRAARLGGATGDLRRGVFLGRVVAPGRGRGSRSSSPARARPLARRRGGSRGGSRARSTRSTGPPAGPTRRDGVAQPAIVAASLAGCAAARPGNRGRRSRSATAWASSPPCTGPARSTTTRCVGLRRARPGDGRDAGATGCDVGDWGERRRHHGVARGRRRRDRRLQPAPADGDLGRTRGDRPGRGRRRGPAAGLSRGSTSRMPFTPRPWRRPRWRWRTRCRGCSPGADDPRAAWPPRSRGALLPPDVDLSETAGSPTHRARSVRRGARRFGTVGDPRDRGRGPARCSPGWPAHCSTAR